MALTNGTRLGTFEVLDMVGAGGMGEVYRARDTRLDRIVALKVLPAHWSDNLEMKQRFDREALTIASLNHPHICTLHDVGRQQSSSGTAVDFLVMEYLQGETLAQRLERGALPLDEALRIAISIADALDKAHRRGVTHRDLKPGNVFLVRGAGASDPPIAKLLDFGLAKLKATSGSGSRPSSASVLPTDPNLTAHGAILGTLQYMAPEQLEGLEADARTDIFAFGVLVHEMITGKKTFDGKSRVLLMSAIATADPAPLSSEQPGASPALEHIIKTCMAKDPGDRWQTARDLLAELQWVAAGGADAVGRPKDRRRTSQNVVRVMAGAAVAVLLLAAAVVAFSFARRVEASESRVLIPIQISADATQLTAPQAFDGGTFALSPDGRSVALVIQSGATEPRSLYVRPIGAVTPQRLPGAEGASQLFWSADSRSIGFVVGGKLRQIDATGGPPRDICDVVDFVGGTWNQDGTIIFGTAKGLFRVSAQGGKPDQLTAVESSESGHYWPQFLPGGRRYLYLAWSRASERRAVFAGELGTAGRTRVMSSESKAEYAEPGYLVFRRENTVYAQPFDESEMTLSGEPKRIAEGVGFSGSNGDGTFNVARQGTLLFYFGSVTTGSGPQTDTSDWQLAWVDRAGQQLANPGPVGPYRGFEVSPDGTRIAVHRHEPAGGDILVLEPRGAVTRLTRDPSRHNSMPIWSPDGTRVVYASLQKGKWGLYQTLSNGSGTEELLYESDLLKAPMSWSPDSKRLVFWVQDPKTAGDLWVLTFDDKKAAPFLATPANESHAQVSFDGKWIAYTDNSIGDRNEIWVRPFPSGTGVYQISRNGGDWPRWNKNGRELFFHALGNGAFVAAMMSAAVDGSRPAFEAVDPKEIVRTALLNLPHSGGDYHSYSVSPDGERFLVVQYVAQLPSATTTLAGADPFFGLVAVRNWAK